MSEHRLFPEHNGIKSRISCLAIFTNTPISANDKQDLIGYYKVSMESIFLGEGLSGASRLGRRFLFCRVRSSERTKRFIMEVLFELQRNPFGKKDSTIVSSVELPPSVKYLRPTQEIGRGFFLPSRFTLHASRGCVACILPSWQSNIFNF